MAGLRGSVGLVQARHGQDGVAVTRSPPASVKILPTGCADVVDWVKGLGVENVVITGGEPLMQQAPLLELARALAGAGYRLEVETNGTFAPLPVLRTYLDQWNVSPKLANSENPLDRREVDEPLRLFARSGRAWFKFVVGARVDLDEVEEFVHRYQVRRERIIVMP